MLRALKILDALSRILGFKVIIPTCSNARQHSATRIRTALLANASLPSRIMPGHTNGQMLNRQLS
jgi:hypothetical protein